VAGAQISHNSAACIGHLFSIISCFTARFLVPTMPETSVRIFGLAGWRARGCAVPGDLRGHEVNAWAFRQGHERHWHSAVDVLSRQSLAYRPAQTPISGDYSPCNVMAAAYLPTFWAIPTEILEARVDRSSRSGNDQRDCSVAGLQVPTRSATCHTRTGVFSDGLVLMVISALGGGLLILCTPRSARTM